MPFKQNFIVNYGNTCGNTKAKVLPYDTIAKPHVSFSRLKPSRNPRVARCFVIARCQRGASTGAANLG